MFTLEIPVPTYIKRYLDTKYGSDYRVSGKSFIGMCISKNLTSKGVSNYKPVPKHYQDVFVVRIPKHYRNKSKHILDAGTLKWFVRLFDELLMDEMITFINRNLSETNFAKQLLRDFLDSYNIDEEIFPLETAYQRYKRRSNFSIKKLKNAANS